MNLLNTIPNTAKGAFILAFAWVQKRISELKYAILIAVLTVFTPFFQVHSEEELQISNLAKVDIAEVSEEVKIYERVITAYSSTPEETDDTPFITASGSHVRFGIVAANWLPIGTAVRIPEHFGDQVFIVEDRMHPRNHDKVDIWMPSKEEALVFGIQIAKIEVL